MQQSLQPKPIIPWRAIFRDETPRPHCSPRQVMAALLGSALDRFRDDDGTLTTFNANLLEMWIPDATSDIVKETRSPFDYYLMREFRDGTGTPELVLTYRNVQRVLACFLRVIPSNLWYFFKRIRNVDGSEFDALNFPEPAPTAPETLPPDVLAGSASVQTQTIFSGIEDVDLMVDTRSRTITIPPRVLYAGVSVPLWNYIFNLGTRNVEIHYVGGYPPTKYVDGGLLQFDGNGNVIDPKPGAPDADPPVPDAGIDWSSGMPADVSMTVARIVALRQLRTLWRAKTGGYASVSVDGASQSAGGLPYGGDLDSEEQRLFEKIGRFGISVVL